VAYSNPKSHRADFRDIVPLWAGSIVAPAFAPSHKCQPHPTRCDICEFSKCFSRWFLSGGLNRMRTIVIQGNISYITVKYRQWWHPMATACTCSLYITFLLATRQYLIIRCLFGSWQQERLIALSTKSPWPTEAAEEHQKREPVSRCQHQ
jgi:hypothetical protein